MKIGTCGGRSTSVDSVDSGSVTSSEVPSADGSMIRSGVDIGNRSNCALFFLRFSLCSHCGFYRYRRPRHLRGRCRHS